MMTTQLLSHVAMTIPRADFTDSYLEELGQFYETVLGWTVNQKLSIQGERTLLDIPGHGQYLNVRASDEPMGTTGYEHMGVYVDTVEDVRAMFEKVGQHADPAKLELDDEVRVLYSGHLTTFRFRYLMPLAIEIQHIS